jgi:hypothetical protein
MATREQEKLRGIREATARKYLGIPQAKGHGQKNRRGEKVKYALSF